jgi:hypothetical protein
MKLPIDISIDYIESNPNLSREEILDYLKKNREKEINAIIEAYDFCTSFGLGQQVYNGLQYINKIYEDSEF